MGSSAATRKSFIKLNENRVSKTYANAAYAAKKHSARLLSCRPNLTWAKAVRYFSAQLCVESSALRLHLATLFGFSLPSKVIVLGPLQWGVLISVIIVVFFWLCRSFSAAQWWRFESVLQHAAPLSRDRVQGTFSRHVMPWYHNLYNLYNLYRNCVTIHSLHRTSQPQAVGLWDRTSKTDHQTSSIQTKGQGKFWYSHISFNSTAVW